MQCRADRRSLKLWSVALNNTRAYQRSGNISAALTMTTSSVCRSVSTCVVAHPGCFGNTLNNLHTFWKEFFSPCHIKHISWQYFSSLAARWTSISVQGVVGLAGAVPHFHLFAGSWPSLWMVIFDDASLCVLSSCATPEEKTDELYFSLVYVFWDLWLEPSYCNNFV